MARPRLSEKDFQNAILKTFEALGWEAHHMEVPRIPGFFDVMAVRGSIAIFAELKDGTRISKSTPLFHLFEKSQPPFYLSWTPKPFWLLIDMKDFIYAKKVTNQDDVLSWWNESYDCLVNTIRFESIDRMIDTIIRETIADVKHAIQD